MGWLGAFTSATTGDEVRKFHHTSTLAKVCPVVIRGCEVSLLLLHGLEEEAGACSSSWSTQSQFSESERCSTRI